MLASELNSFLTQITETTSDETTLDIREMISQGESHEVEFKTTMRYDLREQKINKKLEEVILKTIAAFSNSQGGTLIMGVTDDMDIIGLENDYNTLKDSTKDGFELHLRNLVNSVYGIEFASNNLIVNFPVIDDNEICVVDIKPGLKPLYSKVSDKNGQKIDKFYIRSGNSSPEMPITEVASYINSRFS
ncbi:MAG: ATP-binding protein [Saprospiraceae bacterium]|nr:ATP-binding protein [Saprospiraceae bacterium]